MNYTNDNGYALTYDDIQLVPKFSEIKSRKGINLNTKLSRRYGLLRPIVASPMDTVCEFDMAYKMAELGGVGCIHRFTSIIKQCDIVRRLKESLYSDDFGLAESWGVMYDDWHTEERKIPIMAAIGVQDEDKTRATMLVESGANVLLIDVAHGDHQNVIDMLEWCKSELAPHVDIIAGNIATAEAAERLEEAGADGLRVGIGGGSLCTTRVKTGFGVPNVTSLKEVDLVATTPVMADGGIRTSGDIAKALAVGADCVMLGSLLAGTDEAPGQIVETPNGLYKRYRGSASLETKVTHGQEARNVEGESTTIPYKGGVKFIINGLLDGVKSALSYAGAENLTEYTPQYVIVTNSGISEAKPHLL
jgi:IMP dehydrogenase/GMP reductase